MDRRGWSDRSPEEVVGEKFDRLDIEDPETEMSREINDVLTPESMEIAYHREVLFRKRNEVDSMEKMVEYHVERLRGVIGKLKVLSGEYGELKSRYRRLIAEYESDGGGE